jgi:uncharacterized membrane protein SirB2
VTAPAHIYVFALALCCLVGIIVLAALRVAQPAVLAQLALALVAGGLGLAIPARAPGA